MVAAPHDHDPKRPIEEKTAGEVVHDSVLGTDRELGEDHPAAPAAWVFGTYPIVLLVVALGAMIYFFSQSVSDNQKANNSSSTSATSSSAPQHGPNTTGTATGADSR